MNNFDTMKLKIPFKCFQITTNLSLDKFVIKKNLNTNETSHILNKSELKFGLSDFVYNKNDSLQSFDNVIITFSSKILLDKSTELINGDNFQVVIKNINMLGVVKLCAQDVIKHAQVLRVDCTTDISIDKKVSLFSYLKSLPYINHYKSEYPSGITFQSNTASKNERLVFYDKKKELGLAKNSDYVKQLSKDTIKYFDDKVRIELNLNNFKDIRNYLEIETNSLTEVFNSKANPLLKVFGEIFRESGNDFFLKDISKSKLETILGRTFLLKKFDNDVNKIFSYLNSHGRKINKTTFKKDYLEAYDFINSKKANCLDFDYIEKIKELLSS